MRVLVTHNYWTLSETAADLVAKAVRAKPAITLGLPTGRTPLGTYEELVRKHRSEHLDFSNVHTFNLDEYEGLAAGDPNSFTTYMREHFFDRVNVPAENTHIPVPDMDYEKTIENAG